MIGDTANSVYVMRSLIAELKTVNKSAGYLTDVKTVKRPDYSPDDAEWMTALAEEAPAILVWLSEESDQSGRANTGSDRPTLRVYIMGVVKQPTGVQEGLQNLAVDVRRIMRQNPGRTFPGATSTNLHGVGTLPGGSRTFDFIYKKLSNSTTAGVFESWWDIEYQFPRTTG